MPVIYLFLVFFYDCYILNSVQIEILIATQLIHNIRQMSVHTSSRPTIDPLSFFSVRNLLQVTLSFSLPVNSHGEKLLPHLCVMLRVFSIFFHTFVFQEHLFLMGYRTQPAYVNKPGEKARGAKGESLLPYFT